MTQPVITTFERCEKKFVLTKKQYEILREKWKDIQIEDNYGMTHICNVYYDSEDYRLIRKSIEKPKYKEKFRLRSYGIPREDSVVFLEIKKKVNGIVYKRRLPLVYKEAIEFLENPKLYQPHNQIGKEIKYMFELYDLKPKMFIAYDRIATYNKDDKDLRITFDFNIRSRESDVELICGDYGTNVINEDKILMEIKINQAFPRWILDDLEVLGIRPVSFSKYGTFYENKIKEEYQNNRLNERRRMDICFQV